MTTVALDHLWCDSCDRPVADDNGEGFVTVTVAYVFVTDSGYRLCPTCATLTDAPGRFVSGDVHYSDL